MAGTRLLYTNVHNTFLPLIVVFTEFVLPSPSLWRLSQAFLAL
jgi:hypothetical protein